MAEKNDPCCGIDYLSDCRLMLRFALKEGVVLPDELLGNIARLDRALKKLGEVPVSCMPQKLIGECLPPKAGAGGEGNPAPPPAGAGQPELAMSPAELALEVHTGLSKAVAPATVLTLQLSEPGAGKWQIFGAMPRLVMAALVCLIGFVGTSFPIVGKKLSDGETVSGQAAAELKSADAVETAKKRVAETTERVKKAIESEVKMRREGENAQRAAANALAEVADAANKAADDLKAAEKALTDLRGMGKAAIADVAKMKAALKKEDDTKLGEQKSNALWSWLSSLESFAPTLNCFFGAGLGAAFYILLNVQPHLVNRSYDPKYNAIYAARFFTGLVGGVLLATTLGPSLKTIAEGSSGVSFTPGLLAILGGFATDAVQLILQRVVDILLTAVRGR